MLVNRCILHHFIEFRLNDFGRDSLLMDNDQVLVAKNIRNFLHGPVQSVREEEEDGYAGQSSKDDENDEEFPADAFKSRGRSL